MTSSQISALTTGAGIALMATVVVLLLVREAARQRSAAIPAGPHETNGPEVESPDVDGPETGGPNGGNLELAAPPSRRRRVMRSAPMAWLTGSLTVLLAVDIVARFAVLAHGS